MPRTHVVALALAFGCTACPWFNASGSLAYTAPGLRGPRSGVLGSGQCQAQVAHQGDTWRVVSAWFVSSQVVEWDGRSHIAISVQGENPSSVLADHWAVGPAECSTYDARTWLDDRRDVHVRIQLDCRTSDGAHVAGTVTSNNCLVVSQR